MKDALRTILVFATGSADGGASGVHEMIEYSETSPPALRAKICGVISNFPQGGAEQHAKQHGTSFQFWPGPYDANGYQQWITRYMPDLVMGSGWLKKFVGLDPRKTINIHPALLPCDGTHGEFGGPGKYGHHVHEAVWKAFKEGRINQTGVTIHFVTDEYDVGPVIWQKEVLLRKNDTPDTIANRVNQVERAYQSDVVNLVVNGLIRLEGEPGGWYVAASRTLKGFPGIMATAWF